MWPRKSKPDQAQVSPEQIRLKILDLAEEGAYALFMLTGECVWEDAVVHPSTTLEATRAVVEQLAREGHIDVFATRIGRDDPPLDREAALAALTDERNWQRPGRDGAEVLYELGITPSGEAEYWKLRQAIGPAARSRT